MIYEGRMARIDFSVLQCAALVAKERKLRSRFHRV